jgi:hypothetical protein
VVRIHVGEPGFVFQCVRYLIERVRLDRLCICDPQKGLEPVTANSSELHSASIRTRPAWVPAIIVVLSPWATGTPIHMLELAAIPWPTSRSPTLRDLSDRLTERPIAT